MCAHVRARRPGGFGGRHAVSSPRVSGARSRETRAPLSRVSPGCVAPRVSAAQLAHPEAQPEPADSRALEVSVRTWYLSCPLTSPPPPAPHTHTLARARLVAVLKPVKRGAQAAKATRADISRGGSASLKPIAEPTPARDTCGGSATRLSHGPCQCRCRCARPRSVRQRGASRVGSTEQRSGLGPTHPQ